MSHHPLPHHDLLDELQLCVVPIVHELPAVTSGIKWIRNALDGTHNNNPIGCMLFSDGTWSSEKQIEKLLRLNLSVKSLKKPLRQLYAGLKSFNKNHQKIERAIFAMNAVYREIPPIDSQIELLKLGQTLFEDPNLVMHLTDYVDKTSEMLKKASTLKHTIVNEVISSLSFSKDPQDKERPLFEF